MPVPSLGMGQTLAPATNSPQSSFQIQFLLVLQARSGAIRNQAPAVSLTLQQQNMEELLTFRLFSSAQVQPADICVKWDS